DRLQDRKGELNRRGVGSKNASGVRAKARLVLIVEDDPEIRTLYGGALRAAGLHAEKVTTVDAALDVTSRITPDAIVLDRHLPDGDGWDVARRLKSRDATRHVPIIAFTSHQQRSDVAGAIAAGCDAFVAKPCDPATLIGHV